MMPRWQSTIVDASGNVQPGTILTVRDELTGQPVQVYQSDGMGQPYPVVGECPADASGYAYFYAPAGRYRISSASLNIDWRDVLLTEVFKFGTTAGTAAAGDDPRIGAGLLAANNLDDLGNVVTARMNLGLGTAALVDTGIGANDVPTNSVLGTAAYANIGTGPADVLSNSNVGAAAFYGVGAGSNQLPRNSDLGAGAWMNVASQAQARAGSKNNLIITPQRLTDTNPVFASYRASLAVSAYETSLNMATSANLNSYVTRNDGYSFSGVGIKVPVAGVYLFSASAIVESPARCFFRLIHDSKTYGYYDVTVNTATNGGVEGVAFTGIIVVTDASKILDLTGYMRRQSGDTASKTWNNLTVNIVRLTA